MLGVAAACKWLELLLVRRPRSVVVAYEWRQAAEDGSGDSQGVVDPELVDDCGRIVVEAAILKR